MTGHPAVAQPRKQACVISSHFLTQQQQQHFSTPDLKQCDENINIYKTEEVQNGQMCKKHNCIIAELLNRCTMKNGVCLLLQESN